ncbi:outer membrane protein assembly factor BamB [Lentisalinibacter orientalis]|uniref:outer membrane protein assembly factor BamB n=1 Tax=Lentisalinibacter orientalis TaxID=2992241 RepID=UPI00386D24DF
MRAAPAPHSDGRLATRVSTIAAALLLGGCGIFGGGDEAVAPPAELVDFRSTLDVRRVLSTGLGGGAEDLRLALAPAGDGTRVFAASRDGRVHAFEGESSDRLWETRLEVQLSAGPGVGDGRVVVAGSDGDVIALAAGDGRELWRVRIAGEVLARPAVGGNRVVLRTADGRLLALAGDDGSQLWQLEQSVPPLTLRGTSAPVLVADAVVCGFDNGRLLAASLLDGEVLWEQTITPPQGSTDLDRLVDIDGAVAAIGQDIYVAGYQGRVAALALESGSALWSRELSSYSGLGVDFTSVYLVTDESEVVALSRANGTEYWRQDALLRRGLSTPAAMTGSVVVGDFEGYLHWLDARSGEMQARERVDNSRISGDLYVQNGRIYAQTESGRLVGFALPDGGGE